MHVEARNQVLLLRSLPPCSLSLSLGPGACQVGWADWAMKPWVCHLSSTGFASMHLQASFFTMDAWDESESSHLHSEPSAQPHYCSLCSLLTLLGPLWKTDIRSETTVVQRVGAVTQTSDWRVFQDNEMVYCLMCVCVWSLCEEHNGTSVNGTCQRGSGCRAIKSEMQEGPEGEVLAGRAMVGRGRAAECLLSFSKHAHAPPLGHD